MRFWRSVRLRTPSSVFGGKYSKEKKVVPLAMFALILSMIFCPPILACTGVTRRVRMWME